jgi:hypothetical protein
MLQPWRSAPLRFNRLGSRSALGTVAPASYDLAYLFAAPGGYTARAILTFQSVESSTHHVVGVRGPERLGHDILHAKRFKHSAHWATCDDARSWRSRAQEDFAGPMMAVHVMVQGAALAKRYANKAALCGFRGLLDRIRHFARLTVSKANPALLVANNNERREAEAASALYHLRHTIDVNELVDEFAVAIVAVSLSASTMRFSSHELTLPFFSSPSLSRPLEIQTSFTRRIGERLDAAVIDIAAAIEYDIFDARFQSALRDKLSDLRCGGDIGALVKASLQTVIDS